MDYYVVDAFSNEIFKGNPAGVCILKKPIEESLMQNIAAENGLSETAYVVSTNKSGEYDLRWFTPMAEIDLCGHATLASAYVLCSIVNSKQEDVLFHTMSGDIRVSKQNHGNNGNNDKDSEFMMILPKRELAPYELTIDIENELTQILGVKPVAVRKGRDLLVELENVDVVRNLTPDFSQMLVYVKRNDLLGVVVTAAVQKQSEIKETVENIDFVSRCFCPELDSKEDPVTGSTHSNLIPYWSKKLGRKHMISLQLSKRTGILYCEDMDSDTVQVSGKATLYLKGKLIIEEKI